MLLFANFLFTYLSCSTSCVLTFDLVLYKHLKHSINLLKVVGPTYTSFLARSPSFLWRFLKNYRHFQFLFCDFTNLYRCEHKQVLKFQNQHIAYSYCYWWNNFTTISDDLIMMALIWIGTTFRIFLYFTALHHHIWGPTTDFAICF